MTTLDYSSPDGHKDISWPDLMAGHNRGQLDSVLRAIAVTKGCTYLEAMAELADWHDRTGGGERPSMLSRVLERGGLSLSVLDAAKPVVESRTRTLAAAVATEGDEPRDYGSILAARASPSTRYRSTRAWTG